MSQTDNEQQLRIWKDLAISKQVLMNEAASALRLKDDFTADELREALNKAIKRSTDADDNMMATREKASSDISTMQDTVKKTEKAKAISDAQRDEANREREGAEQALATGRKDNSSALQKAKRQVEDKQKELKAINVALADTPDNILKKLRTLKKQKLDEGNARKLAEDANRKLKKENKEQKEELTQLVDLKEHAATLLASYRELSTWAESVDGKVEGVDKAPAAEAKLLSDIETITAGADEQEDTREAATA
ncbi:MAG: hypothetical protein V3U76_00280 [Granulosicoccus sp.]